MVGVGVTVGVEMTVGVGVGVRVGLGLGLRTLLTRLTLLGPEWKPWGGDTVTELR